MQTRTIQYIKPTYETHSECGWRRCDYLNQRKIEKQVEQHDLILRSKYETNKFPQRNEKQLCGNVSKGVSGRSNNTKRPQNNKSIIAYGSKKKTK